MNRKEHIRRLTEVAHIMLDAGMIIIVSAIELDASDLDVIKTGILADWISVVWVGDEQTTDIPIKMQLSGTEEIEKAVLQIKELLDN